VDDVPARDPAAGPTGGRGGLDLHVLDYITPTLVSSTQFIGNVVYSNVGIANNLPLAAAFATVPVAIMIVYLLVARRLGAFESL
jgi:ABC-type spermidine/putrescine transport system permease subunit I